MKDIIAAGDAIQHAIFTNAELRRGFAKLAAAGHVEEHGGKFFVTGRVGGILKVGHGTVARDGEAVGTFLSAAPYPAGDPRFEDPEWPYPSLTDEAISAAHAEYHCEMAGLIPGLAT